MFAYLASPARCRRSCQSGCHPFYNWRVPSLLCLRLRRRSVCFNQFQSTRRNPNEPICPQWTAPAVASASHEAGIQVLRAADQILSFQNLQIRQCHRAGHRITSKCIHMARSGIGPGSRNVSYRSARTAVADSGGSGTGHAFCHRHNIWLYAIVLMTKLLPGAAKTTITCSLQ